MDDELMDVVDENDVVIDVVPRSEVYKRKLISRVVNAFIRNSKGQLWIPRRTKDKRMFPLYLDMSMGGHVSSRETYDETLRRELEEELRINVDDVDCRMIGYLSPHKTNVSSFMKVYEILSDEVPNFNESDFIEYFWLYPNEIIDKARDGEKMKGDLLELIKIFYLK